MIIYCRSGGDIQDELSRKRADYREHLEKKSPAKACPWELGNGYKLRPDDLAGC